MNYSQFIIKMQEQLRENLGMEASVETISVQKNNGVVLQGITIRRKGDKVVPTIYLEKFYEDYLEGREMEDILEEFLDVYETYEDAPTPDFEFFGSYEEVRDRLGVKLINREKNTALLADMPYVEFLDLAVVFYCLIDSPLTGTATVLVKNSHLDKWKVTIDTLYQDALRNAERMLPGSIRTMEEILAQMILEEKESVWEWNGKEAELFPKLEGFIERNQARSGGQIPLLILTNSRRYFGASCLLYQDLLEKFAGELGEDFFILPSSVHEVILLPEKHVKNKERLFQMVSEVNRTQLEPEEVLSDAVYYYDRSTGRIRICHQK